MWRRDLIRSVSRKVMEIQNRTLPSVCLLSFLFVFGGRRGVGAFGVPMFTHWRLLMSAVSMLPELGLLLMVIQVEGDLWRFWSWTHYCWRWSFCC